MYLKCECVQFIYLECFCIFYHLYWNHGMLLLNENQLYADRYIFQRHFTEKKYICYLKINLKI